MQTATSETKSKSRDLSICVHHYTLRAPCPKGQGATVGGRDIWENGCNTVRSRYKIIGYKRIWVASLPFQSVCATFSSY